MRHKIRFNELAISINYLLLVLTISLAHSRDSFIVGYRFEILGGLLGNTLALWFRWLFLDRLISKSHDVFIIYGNLRLWWFPLTKAKWIKDVFLWLNLLYWNSFIILILLWPSSFLSWLLIDELNSNFVIFRCWTNRIALLKSLWCCLFFLHR